MRNIIVNAGILTAEITRLLNSTGDFRAVEMPLCNSVELLNRIKATGAEMVLMNVALMPDAVTLHARTACIQSLRKMFPTCKVILLFDSNIGKERIGNIIALKQAGLIDAFLDADCNMQYLIASLQALVI